MQGERNGRYVSKLGKEKERRRRQRYRRGGKKRKDEERGKRDEREIPLHLWFAWVIFMRATERMGGIDGERQQKVGRRSRKERTSIFLSLSHLFLLSSLLVLVVVSCALHWLVFVYVWLQGHAYRSIYEQKTKCCKMSEPFFYYLLWFDYSKENKVAEATLPKYY